MTESIFMRGLRFLRFCGSMGEFDDFLGENMLSEAL